MKAATPSYGFSTRQQGDQVEFAYERSEVDASAKKGALFARMHVGCLFWLLASMAGSFILASIAKPAMFVCSLPVGAGLIALALWFRRKMRGPSHSEPTTFTISPKGIGIDGKLYSHKDILQLFVDNPISQERYDASSCAGGFVFAGSAGMAVAATAIHGAAQAISETNVQTGMAMREMQRTINYRVCFTHGERDVPLATGLSLRRAEALLGAVIEAMRSRNPGNNEGRGIEASP